ncbi:hypothetical protein F5B17DRAFT_419461 [Nemania serpens]|nr:hypothetical protein F5B17DRAFT_419461 [Nemania serpens]
MCFYQNVHSTPHFALLNFDARERESHICGLAYADFSSGSGSGSGVGKGAGDLCLEHSCCRVRRLVVVQSCKVGGPRLEDDELCPRAYVEDVFVPVLKDGEDEHEGERSGIGSGEIHTDTVTRDGDRETGEGGGGGGGGVVDAIDDAIIMEFWPEDRPSVVVRVYSEPDYADGVRRLQDRLF